MKRKLSRIISSSDTGGVNQKIKKPKYQDNASPLLANEGEEYKRDTTNITSSVEGYNAGSRSDSSSSDKEKSVPEAQSKRNISSFAKYPLAVMLNSDPVTSCYDPELAIDSLKVMVNDEAILSLSDLKLQSIAIVRLVSLLEKIDCTGLDLSENVIASGASEKHNCFDGVIKLATFLGNQSKITHIDLSFNALTVEGVKFFIATLKELDYSNKTIDLSGNDVKRSDIAAALKDAPIDVIINKDKERRNTSLKSSHSEKSFGDRIKRSASFISGSNDTGKSR